MLGTGNHLGAAADARLLRHLTGAYWQSSSCRVGWPVFTPGAWAIFSAPEVLSPTPCRGELTNSTVWPFRERCRPRVRPL